MSVKSPCVGCCQINMESGQCVGCARNVEEIAAWPGMSNKNRRQLLIVLAERQAESLAGSQKTA